MDGNVKGIDQKYLQRSIKQQNSTGELRISAVPEPSTLALAGLVLAAFATRRRRSFAKSIC